MRLRHALRVDLDTVVGVWVEAFAHDPYFRWIAPSDDGYVAFARDWMTFIAELAFERGHTYIDLAGDAAGHGRGLGAMAVAPLIERCDADGLPCGLVSTNPRNISFYERLGFVAVAEVPTPDGVAVLRPMHRPCIGR